VGRDRRPVPGWQSAIRRYVVSSLAVLLVVAIGAALLARQLAADLALDDASARASSFAHGIVGPLLNAPAPNGQARDLSAIDVLMTSRIKDHSIEHAKLWDRDGQVIWSDERAIIGERFTLDPDDAALLGTDKVSAKLSDLTKAENVAERGHGPLLEVYVGARDANGNPFLYEAYSTTARMDADQARILKQFALLGLGSLALLQLAMIPLAITLARRVARARTDRDRMLGHALAASDLERRRIARDLHDGLVQSLSALQYSLPAVRGSIPASEADAHDVLQSVERELETDVHSLRQMMTNIYPADLSEGLLQPAVEDLADHAREAGLDVEVSLDAHLAHPPSEIAQMVYRIVREGLRNIVRHAHASRVTVVARVSAGIVEVSVDDDGQGAGGVSGKEGHIGLRLLSDAVKDMGGQLTFSRSDLGGARLRATFPFALTTDGARFGAEGFPEVRLSP
jgi:signal transduction histidine kinase